MTLPYVTGSNRPAKGTYDASVKVLPGSASSAEVVRKGLDTAAAPNAPQKGSRQRPAPLPNGECGEFEGQSPSSNSEGASLDTLASSVTPLPLKKGHLKLKRHAMRRTAGKILPYERVRKCGQWAIGGGNVTIHKCEHGHHYSGLETCGSVWVCPVCAAKISEQRREEVEVILNRHHEVGGEAYMMTLTIPHYQAQYCKGLLNVVRTVWRKVKQGKPWQRAAARYGYLGDIRALEITHGGNGWHPHLHILVFMKPGTPKADAERLGLWFFERWARYVEKAGHGPCSADAFTFKKASRGSGAADYVGKWGIAQELTKAHMKQSSSGRTPWQILDDAHDGNVRDCELFKEYGKAFKCARQLTWSRHLRVHYGLSGEATNEDLADEPGLPETHVATIHKDLWREISKRGLTAEVLKAADQGEIGSIREVLATRMIRVRLVRGNSLETGRDVPLLIPWDIPKPAETVGKSGLSGSSHPGSNISRNSGLSGLSGSGIPEFRSGNATNGQKAV